MREPEFYPYPVKEVLQRDTHISKVFITDSLVYKVKKAVNLAFLDYSTLDRRKYYCHQEVILNRRLSDHVYLGVTPITFNKGRYFLEGPGKPVEYAVKMRRLPDESTLMRMLRSETVKTDHIDRLAFKLAGFYQHPPDNHRTAKYGSWETVRTNCEENFEQTEKFAGTILNERMFQIIRTVTRATLQREKKLFKNRLSTGKIRDCHGDLRLGHIYFHKGIQIIDCIEFNERFRYADPTSDLAFLAMDLDFEGFPTLARRLVDSCSKHLNDSDMLVLLDFYKCYRAYVRAKVNCLHLAGDDLDERERSRILGETQRYINLAYQYAVQFTRPTIWVVCGLPASGKSTIAVKLSKALQIRVLRSDQIRKRLFGIQSEESQIVNFENGIYSKGATALTYGKILLLAQEEITKGRSVILDATFSLRTQRTEARRLAGDHDARIVFIECRSSEKHLKSRLKKRATTHPISDARLQHFDRFTQRFEPLEDIREEILVPVRTDRPISETLRQIFTHKNYPTPKEVLH